MLQLTGADGTAEFNVNPMGDTFILTIGKEKRRFKIVDLWALTFAISGPDEQSKMLPVRQTEMLTYRKIHRIKVTKPLKLGDTLTCRCEINVERSVVEGLKGMIEQQKASTFGGGVPIIGSKK